GAPPAGPTSVSAPAVPPPPPAGATLRGGAGRGPAAGCAGEGRVGAGPPPPPGGGGGGGGAAGGLCGAVGGPPPCPPPEAEGENPRSSPARGDGAGSGLGGATAWLRRTSSATAALPNDRCSISRLLGESARATGG